MKKLVASIMRSKCAFGCCLALAGFAMGVWAGESAPTVSLGVVAQRYPWNGTVDIGYKASGLPVAGTNVTITVTAKGRSWKQEDVLVYNGENTVAFTNLTDGIKAKDAKVTLKFK